MRRRGSMSAVTPPGETELTGHDLETRAPVRVFISYAHDSDAHREAVRDLWLLLRRCGIDARIDRTAAEEPQDWGLWVLEQDREADFWLVIASSAYRRRAEGT